MVATTVFAIVLLVLTVGVLSFSRDYFASVNRSNTQTVARAIIDDIAKTIQFSSASLTTGDQGATSARCIDNVQYLYAPGYEVSDTANLSTHKSKYGLIKRVSSSACGGVDLISGYAFSASQDKELLGKNMRISALSITSTGDHVFTIRVRVAFGDDDLFTNLDPTDWSKMKCRSGAGSQFCAVSDLSTTVQQRIRN
jgi:hypothetical protein